MTATQTMDRAAAEAATEAARTAAEASRRTIEGMQAAAQAGRTYLDESAEMSRKLFAAYIGSVEAAMKAAFEVQNTAFAAGTTIAESAAGSGRTMGQQWAAVAYETQRVALEAFQTGVKTVEKFAFGAKHEGPTA
jgi:hypothetical protein